jgi:hypothetical protein
MLNKPTLPFVQSLHSVVHSTQWKDIGAYLDKELRDTYKMMLSCSNTEQLHYLRGRAAILSELLGLTTETRELLDKLRQ